MKYIADHNLKRIYILVLAFFLLLAVPNGTASAAEATAVMVGAIDYEALTLLVYNNNNDIVYYSSDNQTWEEMESFYSSAEKAYIMDISWIPVASDYTLYFKGNEVSTVKSVTIPAQNTSIEVIYDKVEEEFTFNNVEEADYFEWRKASDYYWNKVSLNETSASYKTFMTTMQNLTCKGAKIIFRTPPVAGSDASNPGKRPSAEVTITIAAKAAAPGVKVNSSRLTINTNSTMEYYNPQLNLWVEFDGAASVEDIAPGVLYENGASTVTLQIRRSATAKASSSKIAKLTIPGQSAPPTIGDSSADVTYYYLNSKLVLQFNHASKEVPYEYAIVKAGTSFNPYNASWRTVTSTSLMTFAQSMAPNGCTVYVRKKGIDENASKDIALVLASAVNSFTVSY